MDSSWLPSLNSAAAADTCMWNRGSSYDQGEMDMNERLGADAALWSGCQ